MPDKNNEFDRGLVSRLFEAQDTALEVAKGERNEKPKNYPEMKQKALYQELVTEVEALKEAFELPEVDFKEVVKRRCAERAKTNQGKALNFTAMPKGEINQFYWQLVNVVFAPNNLHELLAILLPEVTHTIAIDFRADIPQGVNLDLLSSRQRMKYLTVQLNTLPISTSNETALPADLSRYIIEGNQLFSLGGMKFFNAVQHQQLKEQYPTHHQKLYQHNEALKEIERDVLLLFGQNQTPRAALSRLAKELKLGGSYTSGSTLASRSAQKAMIEFKEFWQDLVAPFNHQVIHPSCKEVDNAS